MLDSMPILAVLPDAATYAMWGVTLTVNAATALGLAFVARQQSQLKSMKDELHAANTALIDERFRAMTHKVNGHSQAVTSALDIVTLRVKEAEGRVNELNTVSLKGETQLVRAMGEFQQTIRDCAPSRHEFEKVEEAVIALGEKVAQLALENLNRDEMRSLLHEVLRK